jgi:hypothetical protein
MFSDIYRCMRDVRTRREKEKLVRVISVHLRFEIPMGVNIHCDDHFMTLTSGPFYVERAGSILNL